MYFNKIHWLFDYTGSVKWLNGFAAVTRTELSFFNMLSCLFCESVISLQSESLGVYTGILNCWCTLAT